jgi:hypothetical protein
MQPCRNCFTTPPVFVVDTARNDVICTHCGSIQSARHVEQVVATRACSSTSGEIATGYQDDHHREVAPADRILARVVEYYAPILDATQREIDRTMAIIADAKNGLRVLKPLADTVVSVLILVKRELRTGHNISVACAEDLTGRKLGARLVHVTKALRTNNAKEYVEMIPMVVSQLGFPGKYEKFLRTIYLHVLNNNIFGNSTNSKRRPTRGTVFAAVVYRFFMANRSKSSFKDKVDIDYIALITQTTTSNILRCIEKENNT